MTISISTLAPSSWKDWFSEMKLNLAVEGLKSRLGYDSVIHGLHWSTIYRNVRTSVINYMIDLQLHLL